MGRLRSRQRQAKTLIDSLLYTTSDGVGDESEVSRTSLVEGSKIDGRSISLDRCMLNRTRIVQAPGIRVHLCHLETVDAANAVLDESGWRDIHISESRWTGARINFSYLSWTVFEDCQMNHCQLQECTLKDVRFENCDLRGAYFNGSKMAGTVFVGSNLAGVDFSRAELAKCDFRRANIDDIRIAPEQLQGVIVTPDQALYLARLLGLDVRE